MADERQGADCEDIDAGKTDQAPLDKRELELRGDDPLKHFMANTGIPKTLTRTSHQLPDLRKFHLGVEGHYGVDLSEYGKEITMLNSQCEAIPPTVHQILLKAGSPYCVS